MKLKNPQRRCGSILVIARFKNILKIPNRLQQLSLKKQVPLCERMYHGASKKIATFWHTLRFPNLLISSNHHSVWTQMRTHLSLCNYTLAEAR